MMGLNFEFDQDALEAIASKAIERKTGARGASCLSLKKLMMDAIIRNS